MGRITTRPPPPPRRPTHRQRVLGRDRFRFRSGGVASGCFRVDKQRFALRTFAIQRCQLALVEQLVHRLQAAVNAPLFLRVGRRAHADELPIFREQPPPDRPCTGRSFAFDVVRAEVAVQGRHAHRVGRRTVSTATTDALHWHSLHQRERLRRHPRGRQPFGGNRQHAAVGILRSNFSTLPMYDASGSSEPSAEGFDHDPMLGGEVAEDVSAGNTRLRPTRLSTTVPVPKFFRLAVGNADPHGVAIGEVAVVSRSLSRVWPRTTLGRCPDTPFAFPPANGFRNGFFTGLPLASSAAGGEFGNSGVGDTTRRPRGRSPRTPKRLETPAPDGCDQPHHERTPRDRVDRAVRTSPEAVPWHGFRLERRRGTPGRWRRRVTGGSTGVSGVDGQQSLGSRQIGNADRLFGRDGATSCRSTASSCRPMVRVTSRPSTTSTKAGMLVTP